MYLFCIYYFTCIVLGSPDVYLHCVVFVFIYTVFAIVFVLSLAAQMCPPGRPLIGSHAKNASKQTS